MGAHRLLNLVPSGKVNYYHELAALASRSLRLSSKPLFGAVLAAGVAGALAGALIFQAMPLLGAEVLAAGVADALAGTLIFTHGGEWERVVLRTADFATAVQAADLWLVRDARACVPVRLHPVWHGGRLTYTLPGGCRGASCASPPSSSPSRS